jgi:hypothetical protein
MIRKMRRITPISQFSPLRGIRYRVKGGSIFFKKNHLEKNLHPYPLTLPTYCTSRALANFTVTAKTIQVKTNDITASAKNDTVAKRQ